MSSATPPTEYFPGINFNPSFYNLGSSAVSLDYLNSNFLRSTGYAISRAQFTLFNGSVDINENLDVSGNINASAYLVNNVPVSFSQWTTTGNDIYYAGKVGIGTTTPSSTGAALQINGSIGLFSSGNTSYFWSGVSNTFLGRANAAAAYSSSAAVGDIVLSSNNKLIFKTGVSTNPIAMCVDTSNNIGIGKTNPSANYILDVSGNINADKIFRAGTELTQYTDTNVRTVLSTSAGTNMTWNTGTNKFDVAAPYTDTNTRTVLSTSAGTNMTWNTGTNKFDVSVAAPYTLPIATSTILGGVKPDSSFTVNSTTGVMALSGASIYLDGASARAFSWSGSTSLLGRATAGGNWSTSASINDVTLRSSNKLLLQSGTGAAAIVVDVSNNVGIGKTNPSQNLDVSGNILALRLGVGTTSILSNYSLDVSGNIITTGNIALVNGATSIFWTGTNSNLGRAGTGNTYSTSAATNDIVLRSANKLLLQSGVGAAALVIDTANNIGIGTAVPTTGIKLDVRGNIESNASIGTSNQFYFAGTISSLSRNIVIDITNPFFALNDIILRGSNKIHLQSGSSTTIKPGISVDTANNVGIGNTTPAYKLDVAGNVYAGNNSFLLSTYNSVGLSQFFGKEYIGRIIAGMEIENTTLGGNWSQKINFNTHYYGISEGKRMTIDELGNLGIGTTNPANKLDVRGNTNISETLRIGNITQGSFTADIRLQVYASDPYGTAAIFKHPNDSQGIGIRYNEIFQINSTSDPLKITSYGSGGLRFSGNTYSQFFGTGVSPTQNYIFHGNNSATFNYSSTYFGDLVCKFNGSTWTTSWIGASSSAKIKKDIQDLDDNECLNKLLALRPVKYRYIDITKNFDPIKSVYGFIAEEVKDILPEAVNDKEKELIPNIYTMGSVENDILTIEKELEIDVEYTCYLESETIKIKVLQDLSNNNYQINKTYEIKTDIFVYGKVDDNFHILKKEYLHAVTISSVQELYKLIMEQKEEINNLKNRLSILESINNSQ